MWQVAHGVPATTVWFIVLAVNVVVLVWQASHAGEAGTGMCGGVVLPIADVPLWQFPHVPAATPVWLKVADAHVVVPVWHVLHSAVVWMWPAGLPRAPVVPSPV